MQAATADVHEMLTSAAESGVLAAALHRGVRARELPRQAAVLLACAVAAAVTRYAGALAEDSHQKIFWVSESLDARFVNRFSAAVSLGM